MSAPTEAGAPTPEEAIAWALDMRDAWILRGERHAARHLIVLLDLAREAAAAREVLGLPVDVLNASLEWLDHDGDPLADDAIVKLADARGRPFAHVTAGWLRRFISTTNGTRFGECWCGLDYGAHSPRQQKACDAALTPPPAATSGWTELTDAQTAPGLLHDDNPEAMCPPPAAGEEGTDG